MKNNQRIFVFLFAFFLVIGFGSLLILVTTGSVRERNRESIGATTAALSDTIIGEEEAESEPVVAEPEPEPEVSEPVAEAPAEEIVEENNEVTEEVKEEPEVLEFEKRYFMYTINTDRHPLRLREGPNEEAKILKKLNKSTSGYVLKPGNTWCKVITVNGLEGYLSTEYIVLEEMTEDSFPSEFLDKVEPPDEVLMY